MGAVLILICLQALFLTAYCSDFNLFTTEVKEFVKCNTDRNIDILYMSNTRNMEASFFQLFK